MKKGFQATKYGELYAIIIYLKKDNIFASLGRFNISIITGCHFDDI